MALPAKHLILKNIDIGTYSNAPKLSEALETYLRLKSEGRDQVFVLGATRKIKRVISVSSIKRNFSTVRSVMNLSIRENGIYCVNSLSRTCMPETENGKRHPIPLEIIKSIRTGA